MRCLTWRAVHACAHQGHEDGDGEGDERVGDGQPAVVDARSRQVRPLQDSLAPSASHTHRIL